LKARGKNSRPVASAVAVPPKAALRSGRLWLFRFVALCLPLAALLLLEIVLRVAGYGYATNFFKETTAPDGRICLIENPSFSLRFFPPQLARWPETFQFPATKSREVRRIFIFGESAAMGDPQPAYGPSRCLEVLLRERFPREKFEVINLGITAINSHVIRPIAQECAARGAGDVWIIYMGNNEMVGPFGAATVFGSRAPPLAAVRFNLFVQKTRVGQLLVSGLRRIGGQSKNTSWGGMQMFLENQIPPVDARRETVYRNFAVNLADIVQAGLATRAKVILNTVAVNLRDCPPFASLSNGNLPVADREQFDRASGEAERSQNASNYVEAVRWLEAATKIDPQSSAAQFRLAECFVAQTNWVAARERFQVACDTDALPFRADTRINQAIRSAAEKFGAALAFCDAEATLAQTGAGGIAGDESFFEHVHFNFDGNYRLGLLWAEQVAQALALRTNGAPTWAPQDICEQRLGLTDWNRLFVLQSVVRRMNGPPLSTQRNNAARLAQVQSEIGSLEAENKKAGAPERAGTLLNDALRRAPEDVWLYEGAANVLEATRHNDQAVAAYREVLQRLPHDFYSNLQIGRLLGEQGSPAEGQVFLEVAARLRPSLPDAWHELATVLAAQNKFSTALECAARATQLRPQDPAYLCYRGKILARLERRVEAIADYRRAIELRPGFWEARFELGNELARDNQVNAAAQEFAEVLRLNPRHALTRVNLGTLLVRMNRWDEAVQQFEEALRLDPMLREAGEYLAQVRAKQAKTP
jgi:tetratricopeptide (TPR) repeat protein